MAKASSLFDDVKAGLPERRGCMPWYEALEPSLAKELASIKATWRAGELATTKTALAHSMSKALKARGVEIGHSGVLRWLEKA